MRAAYNLARQLSRSSADTDDLVSDTFAKVMTTLSNGGGPDSAFRAYLLTALRHTAYDRTRRERRVELAGDTTDLTNSAAPEALTTPFTDTAVAGLDRSLAAKAFARLPERWQAVLWHTEIEGESPSTVAPILGMSPNAVSALAYRARERLREEFLQVHLAEVTADRCRATTERLGSWTRGTLNKRETAQVETHLDDCTNCRALALELAEVNSALRGIIAPLVLGAGTLGYLATVGAGKAAAAVATGVAGASAGAAAGAASGSGGSAGAAAGAASSLPRQVITAAASGAVLVAAVSLALATGGHQATPAAVPEPVAVQPSPTQPPPPPPNPPPHTQAPPPPRQPVPAPAPPPVAPVITPPTQPAPPPGQPNLAAEAPQQPVQLVPNGAAQYLPITVHNGGTAASEPAKVRLNLPPGVTAAGAPPGSSPAPTGPSTAPARSESGAEPLSTAPASYSTGSHAAGTRSAQAAAPVITCTGGTGSIECRTDRGLQPGESVVFPFTLSAGPGAQGGEVTGTVTAGSSINISVPVVTVVVAPPKNAIELSAALWRDFDDFHEHARLDATVHNSGPAGLLAVDIQVPDGVAALSLDPDCTADGRSIRCIRELDDGEDFTTSIWLSAEEHVTGDAVVTATLGSASRRQELPVEFDGDWWHQHDFVPTFGARPTPTPAGTLPGTSATRPGGSPLLSPSRTPTSSSTSTSPGTTAPKTTAPSTSAPPTSPVGTQAPSSPLPPPSSVPPSTAPPTGPVRPTSPVPPASPPALPGDIAPGNAPPPGPDGLPGLPPGDQTVASRDAA